MQGQSKGGSIPQQNCDGAFLSSWPPFHTLRMSAGMITKQAVACIPNSATSMITEATISPWDIEPSTSGDIITTRRPATTRRKKATSATNPSTAVRGSLNDSATDSRVNVSRALWGQQCQQNHRYEMNMSMYRMVRKWKDANEVMNMNTHGKN